MTELRRFSSWDALVVEAAARLAGAVSDGLRARGRAALALAGGSTPRDVYRRLSRTPLHWARVDVIPTDERWTATDAPDSNARLLRDTLLQDRAAVARLIPLKRDEDATPEAAVTGAEAALATLRWPLDAVLLGMGEDGHFASLFPGSPALDVGLDLNGTARVVAVPPGSPAPSQPRLSLSLSALLDSRLRLLIVRGPRKLALLERGGRDALPVAALLEQGRTRPQVFWAA